MKFFLLISILVSFPVFAEVQCDLETSKLATQSILQEHTKNRIINALEQRKIEINQDSWEIRWAPIEDEENNIVWELEKSKVITKKNSELKLVYTTRSSGIRVRQFYEVINRDPEGIPLSVDCYVELGGTNFFTLVNASYNDYPLSSIYQSYEDRFFLYRIELP